MAYWYACDVIKVEAPESGSDLHESGSSVRYYAMLMLDSVETWKVTHLQSGVSRNVTWGGVRLTTRQDLSIAYEEDNAEPEVALIRTEEPIPQAVLDEVNAVAGGGTFIVHIDTVAERNALYTAYPSLQNRWPDQP